ALSGEYGVGALGEEARNFIDFLVNAGQSVWQILPLGPTGYGNSPYNALSAFAGNPNLIDLENLTVCGDLSIEELAPLRQHQGQQVDFEHLNSIKPRLLTKAADNFLRIGNRERQQAFTDYCASQSAWLDDFALFMALREKFSGQSWNCWPDALRQRDPTALKQGRRELCVELQRHRYQQFIFAEQWRELKRYANAQGIQIFGDIPIFVAYDSADVWANQHLFQLDAAGNPTAVSGVPPDYFSATGQRWGNPLYRWERLQEDDFAWWLARLHYHLEQADMIRIDHFRGFEACWSIPADEKTAVKGHWEKVPGQQLFDRFCKEQPHPPIIAEDLGIITPEVEALRDRFDFPGMKILQFAFDSGPDNPYLPRNHTTNSVVYTGTHDNNTTLGWWRGLDRHAKDQVRAHLNCKRPKMPWDLICTALSSSSDLCIAPLQDILALDGKARFNTPGQASGNWAWRIPPKSLTYELAQQLLEVTQKYRRLPDR
ncbi:MAG: 4-alpha-glucanotransferase, partial [Desulfuromonadales bacterium]|nr:4-alpha-glucanotransferase [Desulfuromonadales bacterium]